MNIQEKLSKLMRKLGLLCEADTVYGLCNQMKMRGSKLCFYHNSLLTTEAEEEKIDKKRRQYYDNNPW